MDLPTLFGKRLAWFRKDRKLSQRDLARAAGIGHGRISNIETGRRQASKEEVKVLADALEVTPELLQRGTDWPGDQDKEWLVEHTRRVRNWFPRRRPIVSDNCRFDWFLKLARERYPDLTARRMKEMLARDDAEAMGRFLMRLPCASDLEATFYLALAAAGALPCVLGLGELAFTSVPIRRGTLAPGALESRYAGLALEWSPDIRMVLLPQVPVKGKRPYRVDFLLAVVLEGRTYWAVTEIDGGAHDGRFDPDRTEELGIPVIRFGELQIITRQIAHMLLAALDLIVDGRGMRRLRRLLAKMRKNRDCA